MSQNQDLLTLPVERMTSFTFEQLNIMSIFQRLFSHLAAFMRSFINVSIYSLPSVGFHAQRLLKVSEDFRDALLLFYGPEIADRFSNLLTNFIANATNIIEGYISNNQELIDQSVQNWYESADMLANFLAQINLFWDEYQWKNLLYQYIQQKLQMIISVFTSDYGREIQIYDRVIDLTTTMGTYMARGLIARELQIEKNE